MVTIAGLLFVILLVGGVYWINELMARLNDHKDKERTPKDTMLVVQHFHWRSK